MSDTPVPPSAPAGEDKTVAILSYCTLIGFIIALIMHSSKKTQLGTFHLQQALGLIVASIVAWIPVMIVTIIFAFIPGIGRLLSMVVSYGYMFGVLALAVIGIIAANNSQQKPLPVIGAFSLKFFGKVFV